LLSVGDGGFCAAEQKKQGREEKQETAATLHGEPPFSILRSVKLLGLFSVQIQ
jgi:hypothetical protein